MKQRVFDSGVVTRVISVGKPIRNGKGGLSAGFINESNPTPMSKKVHHIGRGVHNETMVVLVFEVPATTGTKAPLPGQNLFSLRQRRIG